MSGLENLDLYGLKTYLSWDIVGLAQLPNLTSLDFGENFTLGRNFHHEETFHLNQLEINLFFTRMPLLPLLRAGGEYWEFVSHPLHQISLE